MTQPAPVVPTRAVLTGFGATEADWNAHHAKHPDYPSGMVYNPAPSLPRVNGLIAGRYFQVMFLGGRATAYSERLAPGTPFDQALATARAELPADAKELWRQRKDTCEQIKLTSATLASALGDTGNSNAGALITFASPAPDPYQPGNLTTANFISDSSATADESPGC